MHKAKVSDVNDNRVLANGKWLRCIGNKIVLPGDWVWTDGKCVYGNVSEGGGCYVPSQSFSGIPILRSWWQDGGNHPYYDFFAKGRMDTFGQGVDHAHLVNRGNRLSFIEDYVLDADMDGEGNVYTLGRGWANRDGNDFYMFGDPCVRLNGDAISSYDLTTYARSLVPIA